MTIIKSLPCPENKDVLTIARIYRIIQHVSMLAPTWDVTLEHVTACLHTLKEIGIISAFSLTNDSTSFGPIDIYIDIEIPSKPGEMHTMVF